MTNCAKALNWLPKKYIKNPVKVAKMSAANQLKPIAFAGRANATMNVIKYKANGITHIKGMGGILVLIICVVDTKHIELVAESVNHNPVRLFNETLKGCFDTVLC